MVEAIVRRLSLIPTFWGDIWPIFGETWARKRLICSDRIIVDVVVDLDDSNLNRAQFKAQSRLHPSL